MARFAPLAATFTRLGKRGVERNPTALGVYHAPPAKSPVTQGFSTDERRSDGTPDRERRQKEVFVSTLAHELRQPLSALLAAVEVVRLTSTSPEANRATESMRRQIGQMNRVIEDLLDVTRWAHGTLALRKQRVDVREVIRDAAVDQGASIAERGHAFVVATPPEPVWADADPQRLQQVLSNLLRNAVKYTDPGGRISLIAEAAGGEVTMRVIDTGRGIASEALPFLFEMFSQVRSREAESVGIGLSLVREIVSLHDGRLEARSEGIGRGSEFVVTLPLAPVPPAQQAITEKDPA